MTKSAESHVISPSVEKTVRHVLPFALTYLAMAAVVVYPIAIVELPGLGDYLNHLARMHVLSAIDSSAALQRHYEVHWKPIPYLAVDLLVPPMMHIFGIYAAGRVFLALCLIMPAAGTAALHYAVHRRLSLIPLLALLFSYNLLFSWGFLNYLFSVGLCLLLIAGWLSSANWPRWCRVAVFAVGATCLYFSHLFGFFGYCLAIGGYELWRAWRATFQPIHVIILDWLTAAAQAVPAMIFVFTTDFSATLVGPIQTSYGAIQEKLTVLESPFIFLDSRVEIAILALCAVALFAGLLSKRLKIAPEICASAALVAVAAAITPEWLLNVWGADIRLPLLVLLLLVSGMSLQVCRRVSMLLVLVLCILIATKAWLAETALRVVDGQIAEARAVVGHMPLGARLLPVQPDSRTGPLRYGPWRMTAQIAMVAVIDRDAFVPFLYSGLTTVRPRREFLNSSTPQGHPITLSDLTSSFQYHGGSVMRYDGQGRRIYWLGWQDKFDYVLLQHFGGRTGILPSVLVPIATSSTVTLYRIEKYRRTKDIPRNATKP